MAFTYNVLATDTFHRANENPLGNGVWTTASGFDPLQIVNNVVEAVTGSEGAANYTGIVWPNNQWAQVQITAISSLSEIVIILRGTDITLTGYNLDISPQGTQVIFVQNGDQTVLAEISGTPVVGDVFRFGIFGNTWYVFLNGALVSTGQDSNIAGGTVSLVNVFDTDISDTSFDNFEGGSITNGAWSPVDSRVNKPNFATYRTVNGAQIDDVQTSSNSEVPGTDSRVNEPIASATYPQNSRIAPPF